MSHYPACSTGDFKIKRIFITESSSGITATVIRWLGASGVVVTGHYDRPEPGANEVIADNESAGGTAFAIDGGAPMFELAADSPDSLDILVNNAAARHHSAAITSFADSVWRAALAGSRIAQCALFYSVSHRISHLNCIFVP